MSGHVKALLSPDDQLTALVRENERLRAQLAAEAAFSDQQVLLVNELLDALGQVVKLTTKGL